ncbi:MAG TPA: hypothetical protein GX523_15095 [Desulfitobacterium dehalogenans]|uniref:Uncharacterized protein n=1 Tax=Desulfitobacterium dehalogenans TaxID=36854 RepID=A0A7C7DBU7_9FIRM|nr:hypothetical protein [Desulfitobacterium dehalogenans]
MRDESIHFHGIQPVSKGELAGEEEVDVVARRILAKNRHAFEEHIRQIHSLMITETEGLDGIEAKAARLGYSLVKSHAFVDVRSYTII